MKTIEKAKRIRKEVIKTYLLLLIPHTLVCSITYYLKLANGGLIYHFGYFATYSSLCAIVYIIAPRIAKSKAND